MAWCHCFARCYVNVDKIRILFLYLSVLGETVCESCSLAGRGWFAKIKFQVSCLSGRTDFCLPSFSACSQRALPPSHPNTGTQEQIRSNSSALRPPLCQKSLNFEKIPYYQASLSHFFFIEFWSTRSPYVSGVLREHWNEINWKGTLDSANSAIDFYFFFWAGRWVRTAKILKCLKTEGIQLLADLGSGFHSLGISQWPLLLILHMPLSKGFLFWHLWSFEVSYGSQAMIMIMLITYSTLKQHIYNNQLILIRISVKWINKFLWSFITSPCSLYLSYRLQSCTLTLSTMKRHLVSCTWETAMCSSSGVTQGHKREVRSVPVLVL